MLIQGQVGPTSTQSVQPGATPPIRIGQLGDLIASELHGRFYEQAYRSNIYTFGATSVTALATTSTSATTGATATPILGLWNPYSSPVNLVLLQASLQLVINTVTTPVPPGALVWMVSVGNAAITTGSIPWNTKALSQYGSQAKGFTVATALTGMTNTLTAIETADFVNLGNVTYGTIGNTIVTPSAGGIQNFDGQLIVPPGAVLALMNQTSTTTCSYTGRLLWEEVPV